MDVTAWCVEGQQGFQLGLSQAEPVWGVCFLVMCCISQRKDPHFHELARGVQGESCRWNKRLVGLQERGAVCQGVVLAARQRGICSRAALVT